MSRPLMSAVAAQQAVVDSLRQQVETQRLVIKAQGQQIARIAQLAGITDEIAKVADIANPAQPIPDPAPQAPSETTEQAAQAQTHDDVRAPGQTGNSTTGVPAQATDLPLNPGGTLPAEPYGTLQDVTAPVGGHLDVASTPRDVMKIETDVRAGDPMNPEVAFPWTISPNESNNNPPSSGEMAQGVGGQKAASRTMASMLLARLRIEAGVGQGSDLALAGQIDADQTLSTEAINREIAVLEGVTEAAKKRASKTPASGGIPRRAAKGERTAPSLASPPATLSTTAVATVDDAMLFLSDSDLTGL